MSINDILLAQNEISLTNLVCIESLYNSSNEIFSVMTKIFAETYPEIDTSKVYVDTSGSIHLFGSFIYWDDARAIVFRLPCFFGAGPDGEYTVSPMGCDRERVSSLILQLNEYSAANRWDELVTYCPDYFRIEYIVRYYDRITSDKVYSMFIDAYTEVDYGFGNVDVEAFAKICRKKTESDKACTGERLLMMPDIVTIYRGQGDGSTAVESAFSWTTDLNTAVFFAVKNSNKTAKVYSAKVRKEDIIEYIDDRCEREVLVLPESVYDIKTEIAMLSLDEIDRTEQILSWYQKYREQLFQLSNKLGLDTEGAHGATHMLRVLLYALLIATDYPQLFRNKKNLNLLCTACITHDIGRTNDWEDAGHGAASFDVVRKCTDYDASDKLNFLLTYHCRADAEAEQTKYRSKPVTWLLYQILKDADALDRVRFGIRDLNVNMLRLPISRTLVLYATRALTQIRF